MNKFRIQYFISFFCVIFLGILSRKISFVPLWIGDSLYAVMIYLLIRIFFPVKNSLSLILYSLFICYSIELLQLYQGEWIVELRKTLFGRYVLGQGFLWTDIIAYTVGIFFIFYIEKKILKHKTYETSFRFK